MDSNITDEYKIIIYYEKIAEYKLSILRSIIWIIIYIICLQITNNKISSQIFSILLMGEFIMISISIYNKYKAKNKKSEAESRIKKRNI
jgi:Sec-independent protein secretion pathway component TatC